VYGYSTTYWVGNGFGVRFSSRTPLLRVRRSFAIGHSPSVNYEMVNPSLQVKQGVLIKAVLDAFWVDLLWILFSSRVRIINVAFGVVDYCELKISEIGKRRRARRTV